MWPPVWSYKKKCGCHNICKTHHDSENRFEPSSRIACHTVLPKSNMDLTHVLAKQISRDTSTSCAHLHCVLLWAKYHWMRKRGSSAPQKINTWDSWQALHMSQIWSIDTKGLHFYQWRRIWVSTVWKATMMLPNSFWAEIFCLAKKNVVATFCCFCLHEFSKEQLCTRRYEVLEGE